LWKANPVLPNSNEQYGFTQFAIEMNEITEGERSVLPKSDSRFRPDQRLLEEGQLDKAEAEKVRLEEKQRAARKALEDSGKQYTPAVRCFPFFPFSHLRGGLTPPSL